MNHVHETFPLLLLKHLGSLVLPRVFCACLSTMKGRNKENVVTVLYLVLVLALKLPVCVVNEHQNTRSPKDIVSQSCKEEHLMHNRRTLYRPKRTILS